MTDHTTGNASHAPLTHCENCATALQGDFCHQCGQSVHNPIRHAGHAIEEFFEAFWHLDGRLWRTLRDLVSPGRVTINYLAGHRQRYIAPLRLFVVLSLLTFFIGAAAVHIDERNANFNDSRARFAQADTVEEVRALEDALMEEIQQARMASGDVPGVDMGLVAAEAAIRGAAANRRVELGEDGTGTGNAAAPTTRDATTAPRPRDSGLQLNMLGHTGVWDAKTNPLVVSWWPGFANDWLNRKLGNIERTMESENFASPEFWVQGLMASAPTALFLLVPVFAGLLKLVYLFSGRLYLEHLVVALYSHAYLLLALALMFVASLVGSWLAPYTVWVGIVVALGWSLVMVWLPIYLLLMQRRVYRQAWWLTAIKYLVVGNIYFLMLLFATLVMFMARLAEG